MTLDHQQRWFTGWGDDDDSKSPSTSQSLKTPSLGLTWTNQIAARIALIKEPEYSEGLDAGGERELVRWRRRMRVVFAAWAAPNEGVEFEIGEGG
ncbi:DNA repair protein rhp57, partial [Cryomyces antarcticus]